MFSSTPSWRGRAAANNYWGERTCSPPHSLMQKGYRDLIREFLRRVEWATPRNISILIHGHARETNWAAKELSEMASTRRLQPLKRLISPHHIFATPASKKRDKGERHLGHDMKLRDVLAKFLHMRNYDNLEELSLKQIPGNPDAHIGRSLLFELDRGYEDDSQLSAKLQSYSGQGQFQVLYFMSHRYSQDELEANRVEKIIALGRTIMPQKPNRVLVCGYTSFIANGPFFNLKGKVRLPPYNPDEKETALRASTLTRQGPSLFESHRFGAAFE